MDAAIPRRTATARMKDKDVLFITNRKIDYTAARNAQQRNELLRTEDVFLKEPAVAVTYGIARVSYPVNRRRGDQNYKSESDKQNPLFHFSLASWEFVQSPIEFENLISGMQPESTPQAALLYVHGFESSFNDAAERLAQIVIDTNYAGRALLFSWPANDWLYGPSRGDYVRTSQIAQASRPYLAHALSELAKLSGQPINVLAHSMGTDLAVNGIVLKMRETEADQTQPAIIVRSIILAAPDISTREFELNYVPLWCSRTCAW
jgi:esterase/lipase superfamily enzyme